MEVIAVNSGNYSTKAKTKEQELIFRTKIQENQDATQYVISNGKKIEIGDGEIDIDNKKNKSVTHMLCTLYAISVLRKSTDIFLVVCLPVNQFKNHSFRKEYENHLKGWHEVETENGKSMFHIREVIVYMEGAAALLAYREAFKNDIVNVVDIGGYNVNVAQFDKLHLIKGTEDDFDIGVYNIKSKIIHDINKTFNIHLKEYELNHILEYPSDKYIGIISKHYLSFVNRLRNELKQRGYNLSLNRFFFTGGGSVNLESVLVSEFPGCCIGGVYDTARGLYELGVKKCSSV